MEFIEIISIAGSAIEAVGVFVVIVGSSISSAKFVSTFSKLQEGLLTALIGVSCGVQSY